MNQFWKFERAAFREHMTSIILAYMCAIIDLYDRSIVAYQFADLQNKPLVKRTIRRAMEMLPDISEKPIILHSDQGSVFSAKDYKRFLDIHNIVPSMSELGTPYDNAAIESFFSCLKYECIYGKEYGCRNQSLHRFLQPL